MVLSVRFSVGVAWGSCDIWGGGGGSNIGDAEFRRCICFLFVEDVFACWVVAGVFLCFRFGVVCF